MNFAWDVRKWILNIECILSHKKKHLTISITITSNEKKEKKKTWMMHGHDVQIMTGLTCANPSATKKKTKNKH